MPSIWNHRRQHMYTNSYNTQFFREQRFIYANIEDETLFPEEREFPNDVTDAEIDAVRELIGKQLDQITNDEIDEMMQRIGIETRDEFKRMFENPNELKEILRMRDVQTLAERLIKSTESDIGYATASYLRIIIEHHTEKISDDRSLAEHLIVNVRNRGGKLGAVDELTRQAEGVAIKAVSSNQRESDKFASLINVYPEKWEELYRLYARYLNSQPTDPKKLHLRTAWDIQFRDMKNEWDGASDEEKQNILTREDLRFFDLSEVNAIMAASEADRKSIIDDNIQNAYSKIKSKNELRKQELRELVESIYYRDVIAKACGLMTDTSSEYLISLESVVPHFVDNFLKSSRDKCKAIEKKDSGAAHDLLQRPDRQNNLKKELPKLWNETRKEEAEKYLTQLDNLYTDAKDKVLVNNLQKRWSLALKKEASEATRNTTFLEIAKHRALALLRNDESEAGKAINAAILNGEKLSGLEQMERLERQEEESLQQLISAEIVEHLSVDDFQMENLRQAYNEIKVKSDLWEEISEDQFKEHPLGEDDKRFAYYDGNTGKLMVNEESPILDYLKKLVLATDPIDIPEDVKDILGDDTTLDDVVKHCRDVLLLPSRFHKHHEHIGYQNEFLERAREVYKDEPGVSNMNEGALLAFLRKQSSVDVIQNNFQERILLEFRARQDEIADDDEFKTYFVNRAKKAYENEAGIATMSDEEVIAFVREKSQSQLRNSIYKKMVREEFNSRIKDSKKDKMYDDNGILKGEFSEIFDKAIELWKDQQFDKDNLDPIIAYLNALVEQNRIKPIPNLSEEEKALLEKWSAFDDLPTDTVEEMTRDRDGTSEQETKVLTELIKEKLVKAKKEWLPILWEFENLTKQKDLASHLKLIEKYIKEEVEPNKETDNPKKRKEMYNFFTKLEQDAEGAKERVDGLKATETEGILKHLWKNTRWLSVYDAQMIVQKLWELYKRHFDSTTQERTGDILETLASGIPGKIATAVAQEGKRAKQTVQNEQVDFYRKVYAEFDLPNLFKIVQKTRDANELKAVYLELIDKGNFQIVLDNSEFYDSLRFCANQSVWNRDSAMAAINSLYGETAQQWVDNDNSNLESEAGKILSNIKSNPDSLTSELDDWIALPNHKKNTIDLRRMLGIIKTDLEYGGTDADVLIPKIMTLVLDEKMPEYVRSLVHSNLMSNATVYSLVSLKQAKELGIYDIWKQGPKGREKVEEFFQHKRQLFLRFNPEKDQEEIEISEKKYWVSVTHLQARRSKNQLGVSQIQAFNAEQMQQIAPHTSWSNLVGMFSPDTNGQRMNSNKISASVKGYLNEMSSLLVSSKDPVDTMEVRHINRALKEQMRRLIMTIEIVKRKRNRKKSKGVMDINELLTLTNEIDNTDYDQHLIASIDKGDKTMHSASSSWMSSMLDEQSLGSAIKKCEDTMKKYKINIPLSNIVRDFKDDSPVDHYVKSMEAIDTYTRDLGGWPPR